MAVGGAPGVRGVNEWVDAVFVLTVRGWHERQAHVRAQLDRHGIRFEFVFEHDADALDPALVERTFAPSALRAPHQSLVLKNIHVWRESLARGCRRVLVFEDDAVLADDFGARFDEAMRAATAQPDGWMLFLGGMDTKVPDRYFLERGPLVRLPMATAEGCVHDAVAMRRRLEWLDNHRVTLGADHLMREIDAAQGTPQYWLRHPIVEQGSVLGLFGSELDAHRRKHGRAYNVLRNRWNKFQRRRLREWLVRLKATVRA